MKEALTILTGDCREVLPTLPAGSVHMVVTSPPYWALRSYLPAGHPDKAKELGQERTVEEYVANMVAVFGAMRWVLRDDGILFLNLGDSYASSPGGGQGKNGECVDRSVSRLGIREQSFTKVSKSLPAKNLVGVPWRVAFALQADGWILRSDIIWNKQNPMPESVDDRPTKSHEYLFLLAKSQDYFYDAEAIAERSIHAGRVLDYTGDQKANSTDAILQRTHPKGRKIEVLSRRNKRSVWTINTSPYAEAHFATMPPKLVEPCILAGTSAGGCCPKCGAPATRILERGEPNLAQQQACGGDENGEYFGKATKDFWLNGAQDASSVKARILAGMVEKKTIGWADGCKCAAGARVPAVVLDPFGGSGTVGKVALEHGRYAVLIDLHPDYKALQEGRCAVTPGLML